VGLTEDGLIELARLAQIRYVRTTFHIFEMKTPFCMGNPGSFIKAKRHLRLYLLSKPSYLVLIVPLAYHLGPSWTSFQLNLSSLAAMTNRVLKAIAVGCVELRSLLLRNCTYLGDIGVDALANCQKIETIDVCGCLLVSFPIHIHLIPFII
jgi:hypothetical protein